MSSGLTIHFEKRSDKPELPLFLAYGDSLYQVIRRVDKTYSLVTIDGYEQLGDSGVVYQSIQELLSAKGYMEIVDLDITVK